MSARSTNQAVQASQQQPIFGGRSNSALKSGNSINNSNPKSNDEDDLYSGYVSVKPKTALDETALYTARNGPDFGGGAAGGLKSSYGFGMGTSRPPLSSRMGGSATAGLPPNFYSSAIPPGTANRMPTSFGTGGPTTSSGTAGGSKRPITSRNAAGFSRAGRPGTSRQKSAEYTSTTNPNEGQEDLQNSPEDIYKQMEKTITRLVEESASLYHAGNSAAALDLAKSAVKKDLQLSKQREQAGLGDQINLDLTYTCQLHLAHVYEGMGMLWESLNTYNLIVKNKSFTQAGKLRVNMGNIYFRQGKYAQAVKMYRIALDQIPSIHKDIRLRISRNIGIAFIKLKKYQDAVTNFESILDTSPDFQSAYNLILCYFTLGDKDRMKKGFTKLINVPVPLIEQFAPDGPASSSVSASTAAANIELKQSNDSFIRDHEIFQQDALRQLSIDRKKKIERYVLFATKCIAPVIDENFSKGYDWILDMVRTSGLAENASELEIAKAMEYLKVKDYHQAIETLKSYEKKDQKLIGTAATNISFLYWLEGEYKLSEKYAEIAIKSDKFNSKALNNRGNVHFIRGSYESAIQCYQDAILADALCIESLYNLGVTMKHLKKYESALNQFEKLHEMTRNCPEVIYQIADTMEKMGSREDYLDWMNRLISIVPTDPSILALMGSNYSNEGDKIQAFHYYSEAFRYNPSDLDIVKWLGTYYVENQNYEQAYTFYERAALIEPYDPKYRLMMASCQRRNGQIQAAFSSYKAIHEKFPENVECLKFLVRMTLDMNLVRENEEFSAILNRLESGIVTEDNSYSALEKTSELPEVTNPSTSTPANRSKSPNTFRAKSAKMGKSNNDNMSNYTSSAVAQRDEQQVPDDQQFQINDEDVAMFLPE